MDGLIEYLPFIIPLVVIQLIFAVTALVHVLKHPYYRFGNKIVWIVIVLCLAIIGPILYFIIGRGEE